MRSAFSGSLKFNATMARTTALSSSATVHRLVVGEAVVEFGGHVVNHCGLGAGNRIPCAPAGLCRFVAAGRELGNLAGDELVKCGFEYLWKIDRKSTRL